MTVDRMSWSSLLDNTRIRKALEGIDSLKADTEARFLPCQLAVQGRPSKVVSGVSR
jgi:hypothetical protein